MDNCSEMPEIPIASPLGPIVSWTWPPSLSLSPMLFTLSPFWQRPYLLALILPAPLVLVAAPGAREYYHDGRRIDHRSCYKDELRSRRSLELCKHGQLYPHPSLDFRYLGLLSHRFMVDSKKPPGLNSPAQAWNAPLCPHRHYHSDSFIYY